MYRVHIELVDGLTVELVLKTLPYDISLDIIGQMLAPGWYTKEHHVQAILIEKGEKETKDGIS